MYLNQNIILIDYFDDTCFWYFKLCSIDRKKYQDIYSVNSSDAC